MISDKTVYGFASVVGDLLHPGHLIYLEEAKKHCDFLYCGLICDPTDRAFKNTPIESTFERYVRLKSCKYVDEVIPLDGEEDLALALRSLDIDIRFVGADYIGKDFTGKDICDRRNIDIYYCSRSHNMSSTSLRERIYEAETCKDKYESK